MLNFVNLSVAILLSLIACRTDSPKRTNDTAAKQSVQTRPAQARTAVAIPESEGPLSGKGQIGYTRILTRRMTDRKGKIGRNQLPENSYYSPNYSFYIPFGIPGVSIDDWKKQGYNKFDITMVLADVDAGRTKTGEITYYLVEQGVIPDDLRGWAFFYHPIDVIGQRLWEFSKVDPRASMVIPDIEFTNIWAWTGMPANTWNAIRNQTTRCEIDGKTRTFQQLRDAGLELPEIHQRWINRSILLREIIKGVVPGMKYSVGTAIFQGVPDGRMAANMTIPFTDARSNIRNWTGRNDDKLTFTAHGKPITVTIPKGENLFSGEDVHWDYDYPQTVDMLESDYNDIFVHKKPGTQTNMYLWSKILPAHTGAYIKARWQLIRKVMRANGLNPNIPIVHMAEMQAEGNESVAIVGPNRSFIRVANGRLPYADIVLPAGQDRPKLALSPDYQYSVGIWHRFLNKYGGNYFFNAPHTVALNGSYSPYNQHLHWVDARLQAREDMQHLEQFIDNSTLVEDPEVLEQGKSKWEAYDGVQAYNRSSGVNHPPRPAYSLRHWTSNGKTWVVIVGSFPQATTQSRTDKIRLPDGGLGGAIFEVTLTGPTAHLIEFTLPAGGDAKTYGGGAVLDPELMVPGYGGHTVIDPNTPLLTPASANVRRR
ncbi:hypothetical protein GCM10023189_10650 [Nibrella saemangeumensis]|uniref:Uncharacterized protein n=1 Tax=Nibrella saemangeumensis TaxID=1084526 RepID=A0ABP8MJ22_9BACT